MKKLSDNPAAVEAAANWLTEHVGLIKDIAATKQLLQAAEKEVEK